MEPRGRAPKDLNRAHFKVTSSPDPEVEQSSYVVFRYLLQIPKKESVIVMRDLYAKVGADPNAWTPTRGKYGLGKANTRGDKLLEFCTLHKLAECNTYFQHKECRRATWTSPDRHYRNQIDYIITQLNNLSTFQTCRSYCSADIGSDHNLVLAKVKLHATKAKWLKSLPKSSDVSRLNNSTIHCSRGIQGKNRWSLWASSTTWGHRCWKPLDKV